MFAFLKNLFGKLTVDSIAEDIKSKVEKLHVVAEAKALEVKAHEEVVKLKIELSQLATAEIAKAKSIASKLEALIS